MDQDARLTGHEVVAGTPGYLAPEAITDPQDVGPSVDLYAIGVVAYYLLTATLLFEGTAVEVCGHHVVREPDPLSKRTNNPMSPELEALVLACLAKKPTQRPASAAVLAERLAALPEAGTWTTDDARTWWTDYAAGDSYGRDTDIEFRSDVTRSGRPALTVDIQRRRRDA